MFRTERMAAFEVASGGGPGNAQPHEPIIINDPTIFAQTFRGEVDLVKAAVEENPLLVHAVYGGEVFLVQKGIDPLQPGIPSFLYACRSGIELTLLFLSKGASIHARDDQGFTTLHLQQQEVI